MAQDFMNSALDLWKSYRASAESAYGHISQWDVSRIISLEDGKSTYHFFTYPTCHTAHLKNMGKKDSSPFPCFSLRPEKGRSNDRLPSSLSSSLPLFHTLSLFSTLFSLPSSSPSIFIPVSISPSICGKRRICATESRFSLSLASLFFPPFMLGIEKGGRRI